MDLRQLQYFTVLAETLNFHRAAERLNMSQPPLTVAIRKLEQELGVPLFVRGPRGVTLTAAGEAALETARATLSHAAQIRQIAREGALGERGRLRVGFVGSAIYELLPRLIPEYRRRYPKVDLVLEEGTSIDISRKIRSHQLDVGLVRLPLLEAAPLDARVIEVDELVVAVPSGSPFAQRKSLALSQLAQEPFILFTRISVLSTVILMACHSAGFTPHVAQEATQVHTILSLVQSGLGVALVPSKATRLVPERVKLLRLADPIRIENGLILSHEAPGPFARNFKALVAEATDSEPLSEA